MFDASRLDASQYLLDGHIVPGGIATPEGFDGSGPYSFGACLSTRGLAFPLAGDFKSMQMWFVLLAAARAAARFERDLSMESCLVALSTTRGEGMFEREPQSWPIKVFHRVAIE